MLLYLLDENQRGPLWHVVQRHNLKQLHPLDVLRIGDVPELPIGLDDPSILDWCEENERILVTFDRNSMPSHLQDHLALGKNVPGIFMLNSKCNLQTVVDFMVMAAYASEPSEWRNWINYL